MSKHTPGEWKWQWKTHGRVNGSNDILILKDNRIVAEIICPLDERAVIDANLIAAAPDMYDALINIAEYWSKSPEAAVDAIEHAIEVANEAIAKAEGTPERGGKSESQ